MTDNQAALASFAPRHEFFVGIDSDGCVFDSMELKHKECFIPVIVRHYRLQAASKYVREVCEFINLYSEWRGTNRFPGLVMLFDLLAERPEVVRRGIAPRKLESLRAFCESGRPLGNASLADAIAESNDDELREALAWSEEVNRAIDATAVGVPPFPAVHDSFDRLAEFADLMCVSSTPTVTLEREWNEQDLARYVSLIAGQDIGSKKEVLATAAGAGYSPGRLLMIGDAPGDLKAARASGALFFPIVPGEEEASWERLRDEGIDRFQRETFAGDYETGLVDAFLAKLPSVPPWR